MPDGYRLDRAGMGFRMTGKPGCAWVYAWVVHGMVHLYWVKSIFSKLGKEQCLKYDFVSHVCRCHGSVKFIWSSLFGHVNSV